MTHRLPADHWLPAHLRLPASPRVLNRGRLLLRRWDVAERRQRLPLNEVLSRWWTP